MRSGISAAERDRTFTEKARRVQIVKAAIDTIAEVGYARASLAAIGARIGISKGLIGYHFAGKDDLIRHVVVEILARGRAYMESRIAAESTGPAILRAYIESNLAFIQKNRNDMVAIVEIIFNGTSADGQRRFYRDDDAEGVRRELEQMLGHFQAAGQFRCDFDPHIMAISIRGAIDAVPCQLARDR